jgi:hypothetical protein
MTTVLATSISPSSRPSGPTRTSNVAGESAGIAARVSRWRPKQLSKEAFGLLCSQAHPFVADLRRRVTIRRARIGTLSFGRHTHDCAPAVKPCGRPCWGRCASRAIDDGDEQGPSWGGVNARLGPCCHGRGKHRNTGRNVESRVARFRLPSTHAWERPRLSRCVRTLRARVQMSAGLPCRPFDQGRSHRSAQGVAFAIGQAEPPGESGLGPQERPGKSAASIRICTPTSWLIPGVFEVGSVADVFLRWCCRRRGRVCRLGGGTG